MSNLSKILAFLAAVTLLAQPLLAASRVAPRLIPQGSVQLLDSGTVLDKEIPVPSGMLMACKGQCYIEAHGLQLMGADNTVFAVHEDGAAFTVMVQKGSIDFALRADAKPVQFQTPFDSLTAKPYLIPASSEAVVRGTLQVSETRAVLTVTQGSLELTTSDGQQLIQAGNTLVLAQAVVDGTTTGSTTTTAATTFSTGGLIVGAGGAALIGGAIALTDQDHDEVSPF
jgi:hypothetical protein